MLDEKKLEKTFTQLHKSGSTFDIFYNGGYYDSIEISNGYDIETLIQKMNKAYLQGLQDYRNNLMNKLMKE